MTYNLRRKAATPNLDVNYSQTLSGSHVPRASSRVTTTRFLSGKLGDRMKGLDFRQRRFFFLKNEIHGTVTTSCSAAPDLVRRGGQSA